MANKKSKKSFLEKIDSEIIIYAIDDCLQLLDELLNEGIISRLQYVESTIYIAQKLNTEQKKEILNNGKAKTRGTTNGVSTKPTTTKSKSTKPSATKPSAKKPKS